MRSVYLPVSLELSYLARPKRTIGKEKCPGDSGIRHYGTNDEWAELVRLS